jgi:O-antigen/teichoic acid export membrane protein
MFYSLTRATLWNLTGYLYLLVASLIATPLLIQHLGLTEFVHYSLIIATITLVSSIDLGLPQAVVRALSQASEAGRDRRTLWATSSVLFILTGMVAGLVAALLAYGIGATALVIGLVFTICLMNNILGHYLTLPHAEGHFGYYNAKTFIVGTGNTLLAGYLASQGQGVSTILATQLCTYLLTLFPLAYFALKFFPHPMAGQPSLIVARPLIAFGLKNQAGKLVGQIQGQYGKYLLSVLAPLSVSAYVISVGLVQKLAGGIAQLATALYPASARGGKSRELRRLYHRLQLGLALMALLGIGLYYVIGLPFLTWWLQSSELVSLVDSVMRILVWYLAILMLTPLPSAMLDGRGRPEVTSLFAFVTTAIEIAVALLLFTRYGLFAPVYGALIAAALTTPALLYVTERIIKVK